MSVGVHVHILSLEIHTDVQADGVAEFVLLVFQLGWFIFAERADRE